MFSRNVSLHLKPNTLTDFSKAFESEVVPMLRKQTGFRDEIILSGEGTNNVNAISLWDTKEQADAYASNGYPEVLKTLDKYLDGPTKVRVSSVINSTMHKLSTVSVVAA
jgi:heme-degrading monooxygenase HmoA